MNIGHTNPNRQSMDEIRTKIELSAEIVRIALSCPTCCKAVKELIQNRNQNENDNNSINPVRGHPSFAATNENDSYDNSTSQYK